jgi:hypothetical protein
MFADLSRWNIHKILAKEEAIAALENYEMKRCKKERPVDDGPLRKNRINRESDRLIRILAVQPV